MKKLATIATTTNAIAAMAKTHSGNMFFIAKSLTKSTGQGEFWPVQVLDREETKSQRTRRCDAIDAQPGASRKRKTSQHREAC